MGYIYLKVSFEGRNVVKDCNEAIFVQFSESRKLVSILNNEKNGEGHKYKKLLDLPDDFYNFGDWGNYKTRFEIENEKLGGTVPAIEIVKVDESMNGLTFHAHIKEKKHSEGCIHNKRKKLESTLEENKTEENKDS